MNAGTSFFNDWINDHLSGAKGVLREADRLRMNQRRKESLQAEIALYSDLKRLVESGIPPEPSTAFPVDPQTVEQVHRTLNHWTERVMHEVDDLPITEGQNWK